MTSISSSSSTLPLKRQFLLRYFFLPSVISVCLSCPVVFLFRAMATAATMQVSLISDHLISFKQPTAGELFGLKMVKFSSDIGGLRRASHRKNITSASSQAMEPVLQDTLKRAVAKRAVELVKPGMVIGLGTGSTASLAIEELGKLIQQGKLKNVLGVGTSYQSRILARQFGVKTVDLNDVIHIDIAFDGADEVDPSMNILKGGGAAHTMGKVIDTMAKKSVILVDQSKVVFELGQIFPVPVEILPPAISPVLRQLVSLGGVPEIRSGLRKDGPVITDFGNMLVDVRFPEGIKDPAALEKRIKLIPGVVENGLVTGVASSVLVATQDGDDITIVELDEFVKSLKSVKDAYSKA